MLIRDLKLKFNILCFQQFPTSPSPSTLLDLHGNLSHRHSPPLWGKMMMIRFALNRFFFLCMAARNNAISESLYMQFTCSICDKRHSPFIVCETWLLFAADWILQGEAMTNVMTTDVRGWRLIWFSSLLWRSTNVCNLSAAHKNAAIPSGPCSSLYMEADACHACVGQYYVSVHSPLLVLLKMQEWVFFSRSS